MNFSIKTSTNIDRHKTKDNRIFNSFLTLQTLFIMKIISVNKITNSSFDSYKNQF